MKTKISILAALIVSITLAVMVSCQKSETTTPTSALLSGSNPSNNSTGKFGLDDPDPNAGLPDGDYFWSGDVNNLGCSWPAENCTIVTLGTLRVPVYTKFTDSVAKGGVAVTNFFNYSKYLNGLFPFFTSSTADSATKATLSDLQSGTYGITSPASGSYSTDSTWAIYLAGTTSNNYYLIEPRIHN